VVRLSSQVGRELSGLPSFLFPLACDLLPGTQYHRNPRLGASLSDIYCLRDLLLGLEEEAYETPTTFNSEIAF